MLAPPAFRPVPRHQLAVLFSVGSPAVITAASGLVPVHAPVFAVATLGSEPSYALAMISGVGRSTVLTQATAAICGGSAVVGIHKSTVSRDKIHFDA